MTTPLSQLSFREPEPGLWICKKEMVFSLEKGGCCIVQPGQPVVVVDYRNKGARRAWKLILPDGTMAWCEWQYSINGRWSKRFYLENPT